MRRSLLSFICGGRPRRWYAGVTLCVLRSPFASTGEDLIKARIAHRESSKLVTHWPLQPPIQC